MVFALSSKLIPTISYPYIILYFPLLTIYTWFDLGWTKSWEQDDDETRYIKMIYLGDTRIVVDNSEEAIICDVETIDENKSLQPTFRHGSSFDETIIGETAVERAVHHDFEPCQRLIPYCISQ